MATQAERIAEVMRYLEGTGQVNLSDSARLAELTGLPEALIATQTDYVKRLIFEDRLARDAELLSYAGRDGARAKIAYENADMLARLNRSFERVHAWHRYENSVLTMPREAKAALLAAENEAVGERAALPEAAVQTEAGAGQAESVPDGVESHEGHGAEISGTGELPAESVADLAEGIPQTENGATGEILAAESGFAAEIARGDGDERLHQELVDVSSAENGQILQESKRPVSLVEGLRQGSLQERASQNYLQAANEIASENKREAEINLAGAYEWWANPFSEKPGQMPKAGKAAAGIADTGSGFDMWLDPFKNFANGFLDCARAIMGSGQAIGELVAGPSNGVSKWFASWVKSLEKAEFKVKRPESFAGQLAQDVVRNTPQVLFQLAAAFQSMGLSTGFMFDQIFGLDYLKHRAKGISPENAAFAGAVDAALQSALERVGIGYVLGKSTGGVLGTAAGKGSAYLEKGLEKLGQKAPGLAAAATPVLAGARAASVEATTEAIQNLPDYLTSFWAESSLQARGIRERAIWTARTASDYKNLMQGTKDALYEGLIGGIIGGGIGTAHHVISARAQLAAEEARIAEEEKARARNIMLRLNYEQTLEEAREIIAQSQAAGDPAALFDLMDTRLKPEERLLWLDPGQVRGLAERGIAKTEDMAAILDLQIDELQNFMRGNLAMQADIARLLAQQNEASRALQDLASLTVDGPTLLEAQLWNPDQALEAAAQSFNQDAEEDDYFEQTDPESYAIGTAIQRRKQQMRMGSHLARLVKEMEAQGLSPLEARTQATLIEAHVLANWQNYGMDPLAWLDSLTIGGENAQPRKAQGQPGFVEEAHGGEDSADQQQRLMERLLADTDKKLIAREYSEYGQSGQQGLLALYEIENGLAPGSAKIEDLLALSYADWARLSESYQKSLSSPDNQAMLASLSQEETDALLRLLEYENGGGSFTLDDLANLDPLELEELVGRIRGQDLVEDSGSGETIEETEMEESQPELPQEESQPESLPGEDTAEAWANELAYPEESQTQTQEETQAQPEIQEEAQAQGIPQDQPRSGAVPGERHSPRLPGESQEAWENRVLQEWEDDLNAQGQGQTFSQDALAELSRELSFYDSSGQKPRGQAQITATTRLIRLFSGRNISTMSHESGHLFVDDLIRIASSNGKYALEGFFRQFAELPGASKHWQALRKTLAENAGNEAQGLRVFAQERAIAANELTKQLKRAEERLEEMRKNNSALLADGTVNPFYAALENSLADIRANRLLERRLQKLALNGVKHYEAVNQATDDLKTLADFAGISAEELAAILKAGHGAIDAANEAALVRLQEASVRAFNQYLMEGKAPSLKLRDIMRRLASWLMRLYQNCRHLLGNQISPEISEVFDRMLSTAEERDLFGKLGGLSSREEQFLNNPAISLEEREKMREILRRIEAESPVNIERQLRKRRKRYEKEREKAIYQKLANDPFWKLAEEVRFSRDEINEYLGEKMGPALAAASPRLLGKRPESLGEIVQTFGYDSAEAMFNELYSRLVAQGQSRRTLAREMASQEAQDLEKAEQDRASLGETDDLGQYLDFMDKATARIIASMNFKTEEEINKWVDSCALPRMFIRSRALDLMQGMPIRSFTAARFQLMLKKALKKRDELLASRKASDLMQALEQVQQARVAVECLDSLKSWQDMANKFIKQVVKIRARPAGKIGAMQTEALRKLFQGFRLGNMQATMDPGIANTHSLRSLVQEIAGDGGLSQLLPVFPDWLLDFKNPRTGETGQNGQVDWRDLTYDELEELRNLTEWLYKGGRTDMRDRKAREERLVENIALFCATNMRKLPAHKSLAAGSWRASLQGMLEGMDGNIDLLQWEALKADGLINVDGKNAPGAFEQLYIKVLKAEENVKGWLHRSGKMLEPHLRQLDKLRRRLEKEYGKAMNIVQEGQQVMPPKAWRQAYHSDRFTPEMIIAMALHLGSASNAQRLQRGYYLNNNKEMNDTLSALFGDSVINSVFGGEFQTERPQRSGILNSDDWQAIQGIWDTLEIFWPDTAAEHRKMFGFVPPRVQARPLQIIAADGKIVNLRGGYFPCRYDSRIDDKIARWNEQEFFLDLNQSIYNRPAAKRGHTRARSDEAPGYPLKLDLSPLQEHIVNAARFIEYGELANRMDAVISQPQFRMAYEQTYGQEDYRAIRPNIRGLVRTTPCESVWDRIVEAGRGFVAVNGLALNLRPALLQLTAVFPAMADLGAGQVAKSICWMISHGLSGARQIWKSSPYMLSRLQGLDQSLRRQLRQFTTRKQREVNIAGKNFIWEDVVEFGMKLIVACDAIATSTVWHAAYNLKLKELRKKGLPDDPFAKFMEEQREEAARRRQEAALHPEGQAAFNLDGEAGSGKLEDYASLPDYGSGESSANITDGDMPGSLASRIKLNPFAIFKPLTNSLNESGDSAVSENDKWHYEAARFADRIVKRSNPDYDSPSRSAFLRDKGIASLINQFASAQVLFASRNRFFKTARQKGVTNLFDSARENFYTYGLTSLSILLVFGMLQGYDPKREPDDVNKFLIKTIMDQLSMKLPGYAQLISPILGPALGLDAGFSRGISTVLDTPVSIAKNLGKAAGLVWKKNVSDEQKRAAILSLVDLGSVITKVPVGPILHRAERGRKQLQEGKGTPLSIVLPR